MSQNSIDIHKDVQNAYYEENPFKVYPEVIGVSFNLDNAKALLEEDKNEYTIELEYTYPETTINDLNINIFRDKLSSFTTYYDTSNKDRSKNLELSAYAWLFQRRNRRYYGQHCK